MSEPDPDYGAGDSIPWLAMPGDVGLMIPGPGGVMVPFPDLTPYTRPIPPPDTSPEAIDAELCTWADPDSPCGCGGPTGPPRICRKPGRPTEVRRPYCRACVTEPDWDGRPGQ